MDKTKAYQNFVHLLDSLKSKNIDLDDYTDDKQLYDYTVDEYFLYILCWAGWREKRQEKVWKGVRDSYNKLGKQLHEFQHGDVKKLCESYPLLWQKKWLQRLVDFLMLKSVSAQDLVVSLSKMGYENARSQLQGIVKTEAEKIVDCWLRDIVKIDAFPIDSKIRKLLKKFGIPVDSDFIIKFCEQDNIPIRPFARAVYDKAEIIGELPLDTA